MPRSPVVVRAAAGPLLAACACALALALAACARPMPVSELRQRSQELMGKPVTVEGDVVESVDVPLLRDRYYELDDGTGRVWVETAQPVPGRGERVRVTGTVGPGLKLPGVEVGLLIQETARQ